MHVQRQWEILSLCLFEEICSNTSEEKYHLIKNNTIIIMSHTSSSLFTFLFIIAKAVGSTALILFLPAFREPITASSVSGKKITEGFIQTGNLRLYIGILEVYIPFYPHGH